MDSRCHALQSTTAIDSLLSDRVGQELTRKLAFTAFMAFIFPGSKMQLVVGFIVALFFLLVCSPGSMLAAAKQK
jgi:hypothetical protein